MYEYDRKQRIYERRRKERAEREEQRWKDHSEKLEKDRAYWAAKVGTSRANESMATYNLITLQPKDPKDNPMETYKQEMFEVRNEHAGLNIFELWL